MQIAPTNRHRSLATKFFVFTAALLVWVVLVVAAYDVANGNLSIGKSLVLLCVVITIAGILSWVTMRLLVKPLRTMESALQAVREGRMEKIRYRPTGDEIEFIAQSFNQMVDALEANHKVIREHQELLEARIRRRTEDLESAMEHAMAANKAKTEFLANMSHELRTPMNGFLGMLELVLDSPLTGEQREQLLTAQSSAQGLLAILNDILDLSKIESGRMSLEEIPFQVRTLFRDCFLPHQVKARQKGVEMIFEVDSLTPQSLVGDPMRLRQIIHNLISNSVKFTHKGSITLSVQCEPGPAPAKTLLAITVRDTGIGIPAAKLPLIFEKFTQADGSISRRFGGTGLGLAITRHLVELFQGTLSVSSREGVGSEFLIRIPLGVAVPAAMEQEARPMPAPETVSARILVVEDNLVNQKVVLGLLRKHGFQVFTASHGSAALDILTTEPMDCVLMDIQMPVMDGLEATRRIRADERLGRLPIIAMTAHAMNGDRERCLSAGMNAYLAKPIDSAKLLQTMHGLLAEKDLNSMPAERAEVSLVDPQVAEEVCCAEPGMVEGLAKMFLQLVPEKLDRLQRALGAENLELLRMEATALQNSAKAMAATSIGERARRLAESAAAEDKAAIRHSLLLLQAEVSRLQRQALKERAAEAAG
jgi:signal transduction histidine kinase/CheY-like chemotaxis protein